MRGKKGFGHIGNIVFRMSFVNLEKTIDPGRAVIHNEYLTIKLALKRGRKVLLTSHEMSNFKIPMSSQCQISNEQMKAKFALVNQREEGGGSSYAGPELDEQRRGDRGRTNAHHRRDASPRRA
jgi:hypothetical protein